MASDPQDRIGAQMDDWAPHHVLCGVFCKAAQGAELPAWGAGFPFPNLASPSTSPIKGFRAVCPQRDSYLSDEITLLGIEQGPVWGVGVPF